MVQKSDRNKDNVTHEVPEGYQEGTRGVGMAFVMVSYRPILSIVYIAVFLRPAAVSYNFVVFITIENGLK